MQPPDEARDIYGRTGYGHEGHGEGQPEDHNHEGHNHEGHDHEGHDHEGHNHEGHQHEEGGKSPQTRQQAQVDLVLRAFGGRARRGPRHWPQTGVSFLYRENHILVRDEYVEQVLVFLPGSGRERSLIHGVTSIRVPQDSLDAVNAVVGQFGAGVATPDHVVSITGGGNAAFCPATEPEVVPGWAMPDPVPTADHRAGEGIRVVVVDTGLDQAAAATHPWLAGVTGDPDPAISGGVLGPYAGHGTFIAGVVRCLAPRAEVIVRNVFHTGGATFESDLVDALDRVLHDDAPDVISMSAGAWTYDASGLLSLNVFNETRLRHHKGIVLVAAAGNDASRQPFWPAAAPWSVSVGALAANWRSRADFSNFGGWVDLYAPGENLVNAYPVGLYAYHEPPARPAGQFHGMARWSGTSFSTPVIAGLVAARMSRTGENGREAAAAIVAEARANHLPGVGAAALPA
jgi:subtilisin family serine protease